MPCYRPLHAWQRREPNGEGKRAVVFKEPHAQFSGSYEYLALPCGRCIGCRLEYSRQWAVRILHEAKCHEHNSFITLTYADEYLPSNSSLDKRDFQKFIKRFRADVFERAGTTIRFYHCGEYGDKTQRPHYHACIFGWSFPDREIWRTNHQTKQRYYRSEQLERLWPFGISVIGDLTFESAAYVARYVVKKINGKQASAHYGNRIPEYATMSRRPGIGANFFARYRSDIYPSDQVIIRGKAAKPPRFYDSQFEILDPEGFARVKEERKRRGMERFMRTDNYARRLQDGEIIQQSKINVLKRDKQ